MGFQPQPQQTRTKKHIILLRCSPTKVATAGAALRQVPSERAPRKRGYPFLLEFHSSRISATSCAPKRRTSPQEGSVVHQAHPVPLEVSYTTLARPICPFPWKSSHFNHLQMYKTSLPSSCGHPVIAFCMARLETPTLYLYTCTLHLYVA